MRTVTTGIRDWFGPALRRVRKAAGRSRPDIRRAMERRGHGTSDSTVDRWESGASWPRAMQDALDSYCEVCDTTEATILATTANLWRAQEPAAWSAADLAASSFAAGIRLAAQPPNGHPTPRPPTPAGEDAEATDP